MSKAKIVRAVVVTCDVAAVGVFVVLEGLAISSTVPQSAPIMFVVGFAVGMLASRVL